MTETTYDIATGDSERADIRMLLDPQSPVRERLQWLQAVCGGDAQAAGWRVDYPVMEDFQDSEAGQVAFDNAVRAWDASKVALVHSEVSEGLEELRKGDNVPSLYYVIPDYPEEHFTEPQFKDGVMISKPEGIAAEYADTIVRIFDHADFNAWPVIEALANKILYNRGRGFRHGGRAL